MNAPAPTRPSASTPAQTPAPGPGRVLGLGLDVGGTQTRWALAASGLPTVLAEGQAPGWSALMLGSEAGRAAVAQVLAGVQAQVQSQVQSTAPWSDAHSGAEPARVAALRAGVTGFDAGQLPLLASVLAAPFGLQPAQVGVLSDIELACHAAFAPGQGMVLYAGTGSVAALIDDDGRLQRAGGRGAVIDDAGGGHWIACQALRAVWRAEDESPGAWHSSLLAQALFQVLGGADWAATRAWVYGASRGELGTLALAVAQAAGQGDAAAAAILRAAGQELARLPLALARRHGPRPLVLAGRAFELHPLVGDSLLAALHAAVQAEALNDPARAARWATLANAQPRALCAHHAAAHLAAARLSAPAEPA